MRKLIVGCIALALGAFAALLQPWHLYAQSIGSGGYYGVIQGASLSSVGEHIVPSATNTYDIGTSTVHWRNLYSRKHNLYESSGVATIFIDGTGNSNNGSIQLFGSGIYTWASGASDLGLARVSAGLMRVSNGGTGIGQTRARLENRTGAAPTAPATCDANALGLTTVVNDTDDGAVTYLCYCGQTADDATYDWLRASDNTACAAF